MWYYSFSGSDKAKHYLNVVLDTIGDYFDSKVVFWFVALSF